MKIKALFAIACFTAAAAAVPDPGQPFLNVFFPKVRGDQFATKIGEFCDGYTNATGDRQLFPMADGHILWRGSSTNWSAAVAIAFGENPNSPDSFLNGTDERFVVPWFNGTDTSGCIAVNISTLISPEIRIGANATLQLVQDTGGQLLYQCMDIMMGDGDSLPEGVNCTTPLSGDISSPPGLSSVVPSSTGSSPTPSVTGATGGGTGSTIRNGVPRWVTLPALGCLFVFL